MDIGTPSSSDEGRLAKGLMGAFGTPAFARRGIQVQAAYEELIQRCAAKRHELLEMARLRLATLHALVGGDWRRLSSLVDGSTIAWLADRFDDWQPTLRMPIEATPAKRTLRRALGDLRASVKSFNGRWRNFRDDVDLTEINALRDGYNRYYLLEKECALGSARTARQDFVPLPPLSMDEMRRLFPLLPELPGEP